MVLTRASTRWWHAIDVRKHAVRREEAMRAAAGREWGAEAGDQVVRSRVGGFAKPTGPAGGVSCELSSSGARGGGGGGGGGGDRGGGGGGGVDTTAVRLSTLSVM